MVSSGRSSRPTGRGPSFRSSTASARTCGSRSTRTIGTTGPFAHVLKVFLLDERAIVREIYTTAYLFPEVIMNDIKTLRLEHRLQRKVVR